MIKKILFAVAASLFATQAAALPCANTDHVVNNLVSMHGETLTYSGQLQNSNIIEVYMNENTESWSIMVQVPSRSLICLVSAGQGHAAAVQTPYFERVRMVPTS